jgi:hypothetical protein
MSKPGMELLSQMFQHVLDSLRRNREDTREIKSLLGRLEIEVANLRGLLAEHSIRLDRFGDRFGDHQNPDHPAGRTQTSPCLRATPSPQASGRLEEAPRPASAQQGIHRAADR